MLTGDFLLHQKLSPPQFPIPHSRVLSLLRLHSKFLNHSWRRSCFKNTTNLRCLHLIRSRSRIICQVAGESDDGLGGLVVDLDTCSGMWDEGSVVEIIATRTLPPALTLGDGVEKMKEEIEKLKANPLSAKSGVLRFQVAVPPSTKPLNWLYSQQKSMVAFPRFYLVREKICEPSLAMGPVDELVGVSGFGAAIYFHGSSHIPERFKLIERYLSVDSPLIRAFGFLGNNPKEWSKVENKTASFCFFIPQIELEEIESGSLLVSTLVWDDCLSHSLGTAVHSLELYLQQIICSVAPCSRYSQEMWMKHIHERFNLMNVKNGQLMCLNAEHLFHLDTQATRLEHETSSTYQFFLWLSASVSISNVAFTGLCGTICSVKECSNVNLLWASLIVEECVRLGLTYFCIAPGSRSSPLAIAACRHPHATCISCFDERSLAFHAVGYAKGSHRPAVVITSSGTAVSNLLPAIVEASYAFVPLMLLTADRPPELQDAGANQAIDQVHHFGNFVKFFFSLPPPDDQIAARMVLTTIDSAVYFATQSPYGPVHVNCPFREPLEDQPREWDLNCMEGLDFWMSDVAPFTKYIKLQHTCACNDYNSDILGVLEVIRGANQGLILFGDVQTEDDVWGALLLSKHLLWPVVSDILSGLRLRKALSTFAEIEDNYLFIDHLDHALFSASVKDWVKPDVVIQIGSRIVSKRIGQLLDSSSCSYILVDKHPNRHDPSHIVTHRIQSTVTEFTHALIKNAFPRNTKKWAAFLRAVDMMVSKEISFQIEFEFSLTEPHVAHVVSTKLQGDSALFLGNSMVIRDMDMYGSGWLGSCAHDIHLISNLGLQVEGIKVAGNRGASGIDGLLSTAIGFAVGCGKRVFCVVGDVSFLHDTNGLAILSQRVRRQPMTILVINNHGGAIFSLLPLADTTESSVLSRYFYTSHEVSVGQLCTAHSVKHLHVRTKLELQSALWDSEKEHTDCVIEVESCIADNSNFHSILRKSACEAANRASSVLSQMVTSDYVHNSLSVCKIHKMEYSLYRIQLCAPPTTSLFCTDNNRFFREGFILSIYLDDGSVGLGEVAPIDIHKENIMDVEEQLRFLLHVIEGSEISYFLPLLNGSFSWWIWRNIGIPPSSIFPSVRCGIEMAILNALAARQGSSLLDILTGSKRASLDHMLVKPDDSVRKRTAQIQISALVDCKGSPKEVAQIVSQLVDDGFRTIKLKVARRGDPLEDVAVIQEIREMVGYKINIRADANRKWTFEEAIQFGSGVKDFGLDYVEEPVNLEDDIIKFCEQTSIPVALDETIDNIKGDIWHKLKAFAHAGITAVVIKPSVVGGFERAASIAKWANQHQKMAVISGAFESSLSLSAYIQFANYVEQQSGTICRIKGKGLGPAIAHGLGTYQWLLEDVSSKALKICVHPHRDAIEASVEDADKYIRCFELNHDVIQKIYQGEQTRSYNMEVGSLEVSYSIKVQEAGAKTNKRIVIFLHGFLGTSHDWFPTMKALSSTSRCISIDLPGHGESRLQCHENETLNQIMNAPMDIVADLIYKFIGEITSEEVTLVGYSMGARLALLMALKYNKKINGVVVISGSPGLKSEPARKTRATQDKARARYLLDRGLRFFLETWYAGKLWKSLRSHPHFKEIMRSRAQHNDIEALAKSLSYLSIGRQRSLWDDLKSSKQNFLFIVGDKDRKFREISEQMCRDIGSCSRYEDRDGDELCEMIIVPESGHAVHLENPLPVINAVRKFLMKLHHK